jgi:hypothetical protein
LKEQRDAAKAENAKLENRHVQFMVEGGPVVMVADYDKLKAENDELRAKKEKIAPVQGYSAGIPWVMHLRAYDAYCKKYGPQEALISLEGRNCRGGFSTSELDVFIPGWREELSELHRLRAALDKATGPVTDGVSLIAAERKRQIEVEYWSPAHDDEWEECQLLDAALCYAGMAGSLIMDSDKGEEARIGLVEGWPWDAEWWKPSQEPIRNLVKAGALIAAEIDRLQRLAARKEHGK